MPTSVMHRGCRTTRESGGLADNDAALALTEGVTSTSLPVITMVGAPGMGSSFDVSTLSHSPYLLLPYPDLALT